MNLEALKTNLYAIELYISKNKNDYWHFQKVFKHIQDTLIKRSP